MHCDLCEDGNLFEFVIVSLDNMQWQFTAQSAEVTATALNVDFGPLKCCGNYSKQLSK